MTVKVELDVALKVLTEMNNDIYAAAFIKQHFGGTIARGLMSNGVTHYWNILPGGVWLDATRSQFSNDCYPTYVIADWLQSSYWTMEEGLDFFEKFQPEFYRRYNKLMEQPRAL